MRLIFLGALGALLSPTLHAETCVSYDRVATIGATAMPAMKGLSTAGMDPKLKAMIEQQNKNKTQVSKQYFSERYLVTVNPEGWDLFDYKDGTVLHVMPAQKSYFKMGGGGKGSSTPMMPGAPGAGGMPSPIGQVQVQNSAHKPTGKTLTVGGVKCQEFTKENVVSVGAMKMVTKTTTCESTTEPAAYFKIKKAQTDAWIAAQPADQQARLRAIPYKETLVLLETTSRGSADQMARMPGSTVELKNFGSLCPPADHLKAPADYRAMGPGAR